MYYSFLNNFLNNHNKIDESKYSHISDLVSDKVQVSTDILAEGGGGQILEYEALLCLIYIARIVSRDYLCRFFPSLKTISYELVHLQKKELVTTISLKEPDSYSNKFYIVTPAGAKLAKELIGINVNEVTSENKYGKSTIHHDYANGLNTLALLKSNSRLCFLSEQGLISKNVLNSSAEELFRPDTICRTSFNGNNNCLYIEQDMGTEPINTLVNKCLTYISTDFTKGMIEDGIIIFSFRNKRLLPSKFTRIVPTYIHTKKLESLYVIFSILINNNELDKENLQSMMAYIDNLEQSDNTTLSDYLKERGADFAKLCIDSWKECREIAKEICNVLSDPYLSHRYDKGYVGKENLITLSDLRHYIDDLALHINPYVYTDYLEKQMDFAEARKNHIIEHLDKYFFELFDDNKNSDVTAAIKVSKVFRDKIERGMSIWCVPTELICNYIPYITPDSDYTYLKVMGLLKYIIPFDADNTDYSSDYWLNYYNTHFYSYKEITLDGNDYFTMRNVFELPNGELVCFEHLHDLGGWYRSLSFIERLNKIARDTGKSYPGYVSEPAEHEDKSGHVHLFIVSDSYSVANNFCKRYKLSNDYMVEHNLQAMPYYHTCHFMLESYLYYPRLTKVKNDMSKNSPLFFPYTFFMGNYNYTVRENVGELERFPTGSAILAYLASN